MKWFAGVVLILIVALAFGLGLMAYAMYALLGIMLVSRWLARYWIENLSAARECNRYSVNVGDTVAVVITAGKRRPAAGGLGAGRGLAAPPGLDLPAAELAGAG